MTDSANPIARSLRIAGILLLIGLLVTIASLLWKAPLSFLMFAGLGASLVFIGIAIYLFSLVTTGSAPQ